MAEKMKARLQTPADENGKRKDISLITDTDAVLYGDNNQVLTEVIQNINQNIQKNEEAIENASMLIVSALEPTKRCLWAEITDPAIDRNDYTWTISASKTDGALKVVSDDISEDEFNPSTMIKLSEAHAVGVFITEEQLAKDDYYMKKTPK